MAKKRKAKKKMREVEEASRSGAPEEGRGAKAGPQGEGQSGKPNAAAKAKAAAEASNGKDQAAAALRRADRAAADDAARSRGHADRAAAVAVPVVGAGRFPDGSPDGKE